MILVTGATGNVGRALLGVLADAGEPVRALVRDAGRAALPAGVEVVEGDLNEPASLTGPLAGARGAFLMSGYADMPGLLAEVRAAGVERVTLLSSASVPGGDMDNAVARYHIVSEAAVRDSGVAWTFLQPRTFMTNALQWAPQLRAGDVVRAAFGRVRVATIDPGDVAAVAAEALVAGSQDGRTLPLTGPESLLPADRVRVLGEVLGRELRFEAQTDAEARAEMSETMPAEYVDAFLSFFADGTLDESEVLGTFREVTGRDPRTFRQWAEAHADAFR